MHISKIEIDRFRSIKHLSFEPKMLTALIGQNNAGKSNILRALNLALGETWPSERQFDVSDFFQGDTTEPIVINVFFSEPTEEWRNNSKCVIAGVMLRCRAYKRKTRSKLPGDLAVDYVCIDAKGEEVTAPSEPLQKGVKFKGQWLPVRVSGDLRDRIPFIYIDVQRDYRRHAPSGRWAVLRRLLNSVQSKLANSKDTVTVADADGAKSEVTRLEAYRRRVHHAFEALKSADFEKVESTLEKHALELLGLDGQADSVRLGFDPTDPENIFKSLELYVREGTSESAAEEVGAGLQSAIVVAIFRTYQELEREGAIFAIEEPEVFLHPHRARFFASTLYGLADTGNQVLLSTHSPLFVPMDRYESIALVRKAAGGTQVFQTGSLSTDSSSKQHLRLLAECDAQRSEMFFASKVLLVEGYTERLLFPLLFKAKGVDPNRLGISVIECQGKTKIPLFAKILASLEIPFFVMHDDDIVEPDPAWNESRQANARASNKNHTFWNKAIADQITDKASLFILKPHIEGLCGLPAGGETKLQQAVELFSNRPYQDVPQSLRLVVEALTS